MFVEAVNVGLSRGTWQCVVALLVPKFLGFVDLRL